MSKLTLFFLLVLDGGGYLSGDGGGVLVGEAGMALDVVLALEVVVALEAVVDVL